MIIDPGVVRGYCIHFLEPIGEVVGGHFISIPFEAELPAIVADIIDADIKEATS